MKIGIQHHWMFIHNYEKKKFKKTFQKVSPSGKTHSPALTLLLLCIYNTFKQKKYTSCVLRELIFCSLPLSRCLEFVKNEKKIIKYELSGIHPHILIHCRIVRSTFSYFVYISCVAVLARGVESSLFFSSIVVGESCIILRLFFLEYNKRFQLKVKIFCLWTCRVDFEIFFIFVFQRVRTEIRVFLCEYFMNENSLRVQVTLKVKTFSTKSKSQK